MPHDSAHSKGTILITGASSGLGAEMARQFADLGYDLAITARRTERLDELAAEITAKHPGRTVLTKALDVNDDDAVFRVFKEVAEEFGHLDRAIINAGLGKGASYRTMSATFPACSQSFCCGTWFRTKAWKRPVQLITGTTLTMPS